MIQIALPATMCLQIHNRDQTACVITTWRPERTSNNNARVAEEEEFPWSRCSVLEFADIINSSVPNPPGHPFDSAFITCPASKPFSSLPASSAYQHSALEQGNSPLSSLLASEQQPHDPSQCKLDHVGSHLLLRKGQRLTCPTRP